ncbi:MAG: nodulation protein NfeD [Alphaproteobacteria bacterium]
MHISRTISRLAVAATTLLLAAGIGWGQAQDKGNGAPRIALLAAIEGPIGPGTLHYVETVIEAARERKAEVLVLRLNTPGGLVTSMRHIISEILGSTVPVVGFVAPPGAHAASAGTYILYATHVAAMAPGTNLGAATPVQIGGGMPRLPIGPGKKDPPAKDTKEGADDKQKKPGDAAKKPMPDNPMSAKAVNDAVAFIRSLAEMHGRNADWAESAVRQAASLSSVQALKQNVIDLMAPDVPALLAAIDGRTVTAGSAERTLRTKGIEIVPVEPGVITRALTVLSNPNIAFMLMLIGFYGLIFEFSNPGSIGPGVVGAIALLLGMYALNQLPLDYAGLALVVLGIAFMVAEAITPTFGVLGGGGLVAFILGSAMLIDTDVPAYQLSWWVIGGTAAVSGAVLVLLLGYTWRVYRRPARRPVERAVGATGHVIDWAGAEGHVWVEGERWRARGAAGLEAGTAIRISGVEGLILLVEAAREDTARPGTNGREGAAT